MADRLPHDETAALQAERSRAQPALSDGGGRGVAARTEARLASAGGASVADRDYRTGGRLLGSPVLMQVGWPKPLGLVLNVPFGFKSPPLDAGAMSKIMLSGRCASPLMPPTPLK
jgi:hypothetical protein